MKNILKIYKKELIVSIHYCNEILIKNVIIKTWIFCFKSLKIANILDSREMEKTFCLS